MTTQLVSIKPRIGVVMPSYGDSAPTCWCLRRFSSAVVDTVCLVIDVPLEESMKDVRRASRECGIHVHIIKNRVRTGVGSSLREGLEYLMATGHEIAVIMAGNGKDDPSEISKLTEPILRGECDYVQGSRYLPGGMAVHTPIFRGIFNRLYPAVWTIVMGKRCTDVTNGFRAYKLPILVDPRINVNQEWLNGYSFEYYLHYKILLLGYRMKEVPVSKTYAFRGKGGYSRIQPLKDWWPIISPLILLFAGVRE